MLRCRGRVGGGRQSRMNLFEAHALMVSAAREAGKIALSYFRTEHLEASVKVDQSPVTAADLAIDAYLSERLRAFGPDTGWLSEESVDHPDRLLHGQAWVVDPIDGTRGFMAGGDEWVVSLALVEDGRPILAVILRPATGDLYEATRGGGAFRNGRRLAVADGPLDSVRLFTGPQKILRALALEMPRAEWLRSSPSLALRMARLAEGAIDTALVKAGAYDWDLAAADLILSEAGGRLTTSEGAPLLYNQPRVRHSDLIGAGPRRHAALLSAIQSGPLTFGAA
jgi:myo-inositol-1(or 4)-monophosphatase